MLQSSLMVKHFFRLVAESETNLMGSRNGPVGSEGNIPVRLGIVGQRCVRFVCRSSSGSMGDGDRTSRLTVGHQEYLDLLASG